jgi:hypothetical protein
MAVAQFLAELKRRKVFRVALIYTGVAWLLLQFVDVISQPLGLPDWSVTSVLLLSAVGFPVALVLAWAFDMTPGGIGRSEAEIRDHLHPPLTMALALQMLLIAALVISVGFLYLDRL